MKRIGLKIVCGIGICVLLYGISCFWNELADDKTVMEYEDYKLIVEDARYTSINNMGMIELEIRHKDKRIVKMFENSDDLFHDGRNWIYGGEYLINVFHDGEKVKTRMVETAYQGYKQRVKIYYAAPRGRKNCTVKIQVTKLNGKDSELMDIGMKSISEGNRYSQDAGDKTFGPEIDISANGICIRPNGTVQFGGLLMISETMKISYGNKQILLLLNDKAVHREGMLVTEMRYIEETYGEHYYLIELGEWKEIETVELGGYVYKRNL